MLTPSYLEAKLVAVPEIMGPTEAKIKDYRLIFLQIGSIPIFVGFLYKILMKCLNSHQVR